MILFVHLNENNGGKMQILRVNVCKRLWRITFTLKLFDFFELPP